MQHHFRCPVRDHVTCTSPENSTPYQSEAIRQSQIQARLATEVAIGYLRIVMEMVAISIKTPGGRQRESTSLLFPGKEATGIHLSTLPRATQNIRIHANDVNGTWKPRTCLTAEH